MFDRTKRALTDIVGGFKTTVFIFNLTIQIFYIFYLVFAIATGSGIMPANIALLVISVTYLVFFLIFEKKPDKVDKKKKSLGKTLFKYTKLFIQAFIIGTAVIEIAKSPDDANALTVLFTAVMIIGWVLTLLLDIIYRIIVALSEYVIESVKADFEDLKHKPAEMVEKISHTVAAVAEPIGAIVSGKVGTVSRVGSVGARLVGSIFSRKKKPKGIESPEDEPVHK